jgi:hypothetical protein
MATVVAHLLITVAAADRVGIDRVAVDSAPSEVPPWAPGIFRFEATYTVVSRRHSVA